MIDWLIVFQLVFYTWFRNSYNTLNSQTWRKNSFSSTQLEQFRKHGVQHFLVFFFNCNLLKILISSTELSNKQKEVDCHVSEVFQFEYFLGWSSFLIWEKNIMNNFQTSDTILMRKLPNCTEISLIEFFDLPRKVFVSFRTDLRVFLIDSFFLFKHCC